MPNDTTYTDAECVAALNSCLDLAKFCQLPTAVQNRVKKLIEKNRLRAVYFFAAEGFGLRVYADARELSIVASGDEATVMQLAGFDGQVDEDGCWVRCPATVWETRVATKFYVVASKNGRKFLSDHQDAEDGWTTLRTRARLYADEASAGGAAVGVGGIVLEKE